LEVVGPIGGGQNKFSHLNGTTGASSDGARRQKHLHKTGENGSIKEATTDSFIVYLSIPLVILLLGGLIVAVYFYRLKVIKVSPQTILSACQQKSP